MVCVCIRCVCVTLCVRFVYVLCTVYDKLITQIHYVKQALFLTRSYTDSTYAHKITYSCKCKRPYCKQISCYTYNIDTYEKIKSVENYTVHAVNRHLTDSFHRKPMKVR